MLNARPGQLQWPVAVRGSRAREAKDRDVSSWHNVRQTDRRQQGHGERVHGSRSAVRLSNALDDEVPAPNPQHLRFSCLEPFRNVWHARVSSVMTFSLTKFVLLPLVAEVFSVAALLLLSLPALVSVIG